MFFFWIFWRYKIWYFWAKSWWKYHIYWLLQISCSELRSFLSQKVDGKIIFTDYWKSVVLNFLVMGNTAFLTALKLMERLYLLGVFELSMIFQDLGIMTFHATDGVAIGSPLAPVLANIFMCFHKSKWLNKYNLNKYKFY